ncbi:sensor histidine kinase [Mucilaginibacter lutimaris]|uniref:Sensor histidine kinase n=1 Tax=Mucilaginibacter lutimaris TaxID=931629 RepID=A0ABW2Z967_9SPHI
MIIIKKVVFYHAIAWIIFIAYEVSTIYFLTGRTAAFMDYLPHYVMNIVLFYLIVKIITSNKYRYKYLWVTSILLSYIFINYWLNTFLESYVVKQSHPVNSLRSFLVSSFYRGIYFIGLGTLYGFASNLLYSGRTINALKEEKLQKENDRISLEKDLLRSQNALLRAQINPHLFFNTLNFIYNAVYKVSDKAGEAVMLLADITRYSITKTDENGMALLSDELASIEDLISLNQIRFSSRLHIRFENKVEGGEIRIVPLVMLTLVENVVKYGDLHDAEHPALIKVQLEDGFLHFSTRNKKLNDLHKLKGNGLGLENIRMRMQNAYAGKFSLRTNETEDMFFTDLTIHTDCLCLAAIS